MMIVPAPGPPNSEFCFTVGLEKMKETKETKRDLIRRRSLRSEATAKRRKKTKKTKQDHERRQGRRRETKARPRRRTMTAKQDHARRQRRQIETTKVDKEDEVSPRKNNQKKTMKIKQDQKKTKLGSKPMAAALSQNIVRAFVNGCSVFGMFGVRGCERSGSCSGL